MPTMAERVAGLEVEVKHAREDINEVKSDVKTLVAWQSEERGARRQRRLFFSVAVVVIPIGASLLMKVVFG